MSTWTHAICLACWNEKFSNRGEPFMMVPSEVEICCFCGEHTSDGIYVRVNPGTVSFCQHKVTE